MLATALSPTAPLVLARSSTTPYDERPRMNPTARTNRTKAATAAGFAPCQPEAWPPPHRRTEAARTDQPRTLTTENTGQAYFSQRLRSFDQAGASARPAVATASDHMAAGRSMDAALSPENGRFRCSASRVNGV